MMKKFFAVFSILGALWTFQVQGQTLNNLFPVDGFVPTLAVPFEITGSGTITIRQILFDRNDGDCKSLIDPLAASIFHIRCQNEGIVQVRALYVQNNGSLKSLSSPAIEFKYPAGGTIIVPEPEDPELAAGYRLYMTYCVSCHIAKDKPKRTAAQISEAYITKPKMKEKADQGFKPNASEINLIAKYLRTFN